MPCWLPSATVARMRRGNAVWEAAIVLGVGLGLWMALLANDCPRSSRGNGPICPVVPGVPLFAWWVCALCGAAAASLVVLVAMAIRRSHSN